MSRMPPVPPASRPTKGPEGVEKMSVDVTHRLRRRSRARPQSPARGGAPAGSVSWPRLAVACAAGYAIGWFVATQR